MKRTKLLALALGVTLCFGNLAVTYARDDDISFSFGIKSLERVSRYEKGRYRETTKTNNPWKVNLSKSGEGSGKVTTFYLSGYDWSQVSPSVNVKQGNGSYYRDAYESASKRTVYLTGCNNNFSVDGYTVSGYWDEETH